MARSSNNLSSTGQSGNNSSNFRDIIIGFLASIVFAIFSHIFSYFYPVFIKHDIKLLIALTILWIIRWYAVSHNRIAALVGIVLPIIPLLALIYLKPLCPEENIMLEHEYKSNKNFISEHNRKVEEEEGDSLQIIALTEGQYYKETALLPTSLYCEWFYEGDGHHRRTDNCVFSVTPGTDKTDDIVSVVAERPLCTDKYRGVFFIPNEEEE